MNKITEEKIKDLKDRVLKFNMLKLPGQPQIGHVGTHRLVNDLWHELQRRLNQ